MPTDITFPAPNLVGFLDALACSLEQDGELLWARRHIAGEQVQVAFYPLRTTDGDAMSQAIRVLVRAGRSEPSAALNLIMIEGCALRDEDAKRFTEIDAKVASETDYLASTIQGHRVCDELIKEADDFIPEQRYVEQRMLPGNVRSADFLRDWMQSNDTGLLVVLGQAGHGKSCLANHLSRRLANDHLKDARNPVPFLLQLHRHRHVRRFDELVLTHLQDRGVHGFTSSAFAQLVNQGRVLPVLDGFDELAETGGLSVARETLRGLVDRINPSAKVLLTSRQAYFRHRGDLSLLGRDQVLSNLETVELQPFDDTERATFLRSRGLQKEQIRQVEEHVKKVGAEELLASPLVLRILGDEVKEGTSFEGSTATDVFALSLRKICEREVPKGKFPWPPETQIEFLERVADLMHEENAYQLVNCDEWLSDIVQADVPKGLSRAKKQEEENARVVQFKNHAIVSAFSVDGFDAIEFPHPLYRDFFIANQFKEASCSESRARSALRSGLPEASARFLADLLSEAQLGDWIQRCTEWRESMRDIWACILFKCDVASKSDIDSRTRTFQSCLGAKRTFNYETLSRLRFSLLRFEGFSFVGTDFTGCAFQSCQFTNCSFNGARLGGCQMYGCSADEQTGEVLESLGIQRGAVQKRFLRAPVVHLESQDPVRELVEKFFSRFIRKELGSHQRTSKVRSMTAGLGGEERKFTERELIPEMKKNGVITPHQGIDVYVFNADWQNDGDSVLGGNEPTERLSTIMETLRGKAARYNLL